MPHEAYLAQEELSPRPSIGMSPIPLEGGSALRQVVILRMLLICGIALASASCRPNTTDPLQDVSAADLAGTWATHYYSKGETDTLILRPDGKFQQVYRDTGSGYSFETGWNDWWLEPLEDAGVRLHLKGARFYVMGVARAEAEGMMACVDRADCLQPVPFIDRFTGEVVYMPGELVVDVRSEGDSLILYHMSFGAEGLFPLIGAEHAIFRLVSRQTD